MNQAMKCADILSIWPVDLGGICSPKTGRFMWDLDLENRSIYAGPDTKNQKPRVVPCSLELILELKVIAEENRKKSKTDARSSKPYEGTVFQNHVGLPVDNQNFVKRHFHRDVKEWGGTRIRFHDLRHTATTLMIANGVDIKTVKEICGHADISTTMNYVHLVASALDKVPQLFSLSPTKA